MKILLAADGSKYTKKALAFIVTHEAFSGPDNELIVLHVQPPVPPRVKTMLGAAAVASYHRGEADKVLDPIRAFMARHQIKTRFDWKTGLIAKEILDRAAREKAHLIVMGTHGHGLLGRALMGSIAQRVVTLSSVPVLLVK